MKALVTGASGFIGSTLIEELGTLGFDVYALMRKTSSSSNLDGLVMTRLDGDLSSIESIRAAVREIPDLDYVFHLAGATTGPNRDFYFEHNTRGTARLAQVVAEECPRLQRFVHVSSLAAAGPAHGMNPRRETEESHPVSSYGESKLDAETEVLRYKDKYPITIVRPPMVYGPKDKGVFVMIKTVARNLMPVISGKEGGKKYYSVIHSKDLCRGLVQSALAKTDKVPSGEIFYFCNDDFVSYDQIMSTAAEKLGLDPLRFRIPKAALYLGAVGGTVAGLLSKKASPLNLDKLNEIRPDYWICSNQKAKEVFDFVPEFSFVTGMSSTIDWYKRHNWL